MDHQSYYDENVPRRLRDYLFGNVRIEKALSSIALGVDMLPRSVLEVGCGIGFVAFQLQERWPHARVVGIDTSPVSIDVANHLFGTSGVRYEQGRLEEITLPLTFDLIILMDVYEHVEISWRASLHKRISSLLAPAGSLFVSVPTPEYQHYLRMERPSGLQPIDEDVSICDLEGLAHACQATITSYERVTVWRKLDYAHCWMRRVPQAGSGRPVPPTMVKRVGRRIRRAVAKNGLQRKRRANRIVKRLGPQWLEAAKQA